MTPCDSKVSWLPSAITGPQTHGARVASPLDTSVVRAEEFSGTYGRKTHAARSDGILKIDATAIGPACSACPQPLDTSPKAVQVLSYIKSRELGLGRVPDHDDFPRATTVAHHGGAIFTRMTGRFPMTSTCVARCTTLGVLTLLLAAGRATAQGQMGGMSHQGMSHQGMEQQGMSGAMMAQMQSMMERSAQMVQRTQQMTQVAQGMPMSAPGAHLMHLMTENLSTMSVQMKGLTSQMNDLMADQKAMATGTMHAELGTMQKSMNEMLGNMDRMLKSMEKMQQNVPAPAKP